MDQLLHDAGHAIALAMEAVAIVLIAAGGAEALIGIARALVKGATRAQRREVWLDFAGWLVAALTFQLAADIAGTSFAPSSDEAGHLAAGGDPHVPQLLPRLRGGKDARPAARARVAMKENARRCPAALGRRTEEKA
jgi:uncharacterized membrane protein